MFSLRICATAAFLSALVVAEQTLGQECDFKGSDARQSSVDECPCFHSDTDPDSEECSAIASSSRSPRNPLLPCSFLPKVTQGLMRLIQFDADSMTLEEIA